MWSKRGYILTLDTLCPRPLFVFPLTWLCLQFIQPTVPIPSISTHWPQFGLVLSHKLLLNFENIWINCKLCYLVVRFSWNAGYIHSLTKIYPRIKSGQTVGIARSKLVLSEDNSKISWYKGKVNLRTGYVQTRDRVWINWGYSNFVIIIAAFSLII